MPGSHSIIVNSTLIMAVALMIGISHGDEPPQRWRLDEPISPEAILYPSSINEAGDVGGTAYLTNSQSQGMQPFIYKNGTVSLLGNPFPYMSVYGINEAGMGVASVRTTGELFQYSLDGGMPLLDTIDDSYGGTIYLTRPSLDGSFGGHYLDSAGDYSTFVWNNSTGVIPVLEETQRTYAMDMSEAGDLIGYGYDEAIANGTICYLHQDGVQREFHDFLPGIGAPQMINENGQILTLVLDPEDLSSRSYYLVDSKDFSYQLVRGDDHSEYVSEITINAAGQAAILNSPVDGGHNTIDLWSPDGTVTPLETIDDSKILFLDHLSESGTVLVNSIDSVQYNSTMYLTSPDHGVININDRIIGFAGPEFITLLSTMSNDNWEMTISLFTTTGSTTRYGVLRPANPGDVDGDDQVDVSDVLEIISSWGDWPVGSVCGPDLNMDGQVDVSDVLQCLDNWP